MDISQAYVRLVQQPTSRPIYFRYPSEGRPVFAIPGDTDGTYITIEVGGFCGTAYLFVYIVTADEPYRMHSHRLVNRISNLIKDGALRQRIRVNGVRMEIVLDGLGIQTTKRDQAAAQLELCQCNRYDPFRAGFDHIGNIQQIGMDRVRLAIQLVIERDPHATDKSRRFVSLPAIVTNVITNQRLAQPLIIDDFLAEHSSVYGNAKSHILCTKISRVTVEVHFVQRNERNEIVWLELASGVHMHRQMAIIFRTPPYYNPLIEQPVTVQVYIYLPQNNEYSNPVDFVYTPDPNILRLRRKRVHPTMRDNIQCGLDEADRSGHQFIPLTTFQATVDGSQLPTSYVATQFGHGLGQCNPSIFVGAGVESAANVHGAISLPTYAHTCQPDPSRELQYASTARNEPASIIQPDCVVPDLGAVIDNETAVGEESVDPAIEQLTDELVTLNTGELIDAIVDFEKSDYEKLVAVP